MTEDQLPAITFRVVLEVDAPYDPGNPGWSREFAQTESIYLGDHRIEGLRLLSVASTAALSALGRANDCRHDSASGVDDDDGPDKVWRCDHCGLLWREDGQAVTAPAEPDVDRTARTGADQ